MRVSEFKTWDSIAGEMYEPFNLNEFLMGSCSMAGHYVYLQFTGFTDVNGNKIFEGDILKYINLSSGKEKIKGYVVFEKGCFRLKHIDKNIAVDCVNLVSLGKLNKYFSVVGNIYQNGNLIK
jgi:uncharacterized phage protein (TIGR01671 family)